MNRQLDRPLTMERWQHVSANHDHTSDGTLAHLSDTPTDDDVVNKRLQQLKQVFKTAREIAPEDHIKMVAALQPHVDNGISKTVNLPCRTTVDQVQEILLYALDAGLKGLTVYRDASREQQPRS